MFLLHNVVSRCASSSYKAKDHTARPPDSTHTSPIARKSVWFVESVASHTPLGTHDKRDMDCLVSRWVKKYDMFFLVPNEPLLGSWRKMIMPL